MLFVGLGNPGRRYAKTRHNAGFEVVNAFAAKQGWPWREEVRFHAEVAKGAVGGQKVLLAKPTTYMNLSGEAVRALMDYYQLPLTSLVVVVDDVALPLGECRLRETGSSGGHNGLKSIEAHVQSRDYLRLRIGVGSPPPLMALESYVLEAFTNEEEKIIQKKIIEAVDILEHLCSEDPAQVMTRVNKKSPSNGTGEKENESKKSKTV